MPKYQVFFSFEYVKDCWRTAEIRNIGKVNGKQIFSDNDWEEVRDKSEEKIKEWIDSQLAMRSCLVVLIGATTSTRKWVQYEIKKAYQLRKGMVGIYVHKLKDKNGCQTRKGENPFEQLRFTSDIEKLSRYVTCYDSPCTTSSAVYRDIEAHIESLIEEAVRKAGTY